jgi:hypothetical protein
MILNKAASSPLSALRLYCFICDLLGCADPGRYYEEGAEFL